MPGMTLLVVFGSWVLLLALTIVRYVRSGGEDDDER